MSAVKQEVKEVSDAGMIYSALAAVQKGLAKDGVGKNAKNAQQGFMYRAWDEVQQALAGHLADNNVIGPMINVSAHSLTEAGKTKNGATMWRCVLRGDVTFCHGDDGSSIAISGIGEATDMGDKATSKATTMLVKYAVINAFCIPLEGIADGDAETPDPVERTASNSSMRSDNDPNWTGPLNKTQLKAVAREIASNIQGAGDEDELLAYIKSDEVKAAVEQLSADLPEFFSAYRKAVTARFASFHEFPDFPRDLPIDFAREE